MFHQEKTSGTLIFRFNNDSERLEAIREAAGIIKNGGLVAFPTETVYGLGASALNISAVESIFKAKKRPADNPLIVHIDELTWLSVLAKDIPDEALVLAREFWPGPLTLVLSRREIVPGVVSAGLNTVAIRMPDHSVALDLIRFAGVPVAAPSANLSGSPSPTEAIHVYSDLSGSIDAILDGGACSVGLESTVLDMSEKEPVLLRPGGVNIETIEDCLGRTLRRAEENVEGPTPSPGMKYRHYAPRAKLILFTGEGEQSIRNMVSIAGEYGDRGMSLGILCYDQEESCFPGSIVETLGNDRDLSEASATLYSALRRLDICRVDVILARGSVETGLGLALMNRLRKAAALVIDSEEAINWEETLLFAGGDYN